MQNYFHNTYSHQFTYGLYLQVENLDVDKNIQIKFQVTYVSGGISDSARWFFTCVNDSSKEAYKFANFAQGTPYVEILAEHVQTESGNKLSITREATWLTLNITSEQLKALGYQDGDTQIAFMFVNTAGNQSGYSAGMRIEYVKYVD